MPFLRLGIGYQVVEGLEEVRRVVWAWSGFWMVLYGKYRKLFVAQARDRVVVQVVFGDNGFVFLKVINRGGETMVLRSDCDPAGFHVLYGLVASPVSEFQLVGGSSQGMCDDLVAQTNAKDGKVGQEVSHGFMGIGNGCWISRTVGEKDGIRSFAANLFGRGVGRQDLHLEQLQPAEGLPEGLGRQGDRDDL